VRETARGKDGAPASGPERWGAVTRGKLADAPRGRGSQTAPKWGLGPNRRARTVSPRKTQGSPSSQRGPQGEIQGFATLKRQICGRISPTRKTDPLVRFKFRINDVAVHVTRSELCVFFFLRTNIHVDQGLVRQICGRISPTRKTEPWCGLCFGLKMS
jgi:hypothetical protein